VQVFNDAPWLAQRIDRSKLPIAHPALANAVNFTLQITPLSSAIVESLEPQFTPVPAGDWFA
jgi:hypothetical protein